MDSVEAAKAWRERNTHRLKARSKPPTDRVETLDTSVTPEQLEARASKVKRPATIEEAEQYLAELEEMRRFAKENAESLWSQNFPDDSRKWLAVHQSIAKGYPLAHQKVLELRERHKVTITTAEAQATFTAFLSRLRQLCDTMPASLAAKVNPADPDHAREQLETWRDSVLFKSLSQAPAVS